METTEHRVALPANARASCELWVAQIDPVGDPLQWSLVEA